MLLWLVTFHKHRYKLQFLVYAVYLIPTGLLSGDEAQKTDCYKDSVAVVMRVRESEGGALLDLFQSDKQLA